MDMETPAAGTAQGDLADVVARAGAVMAAAAPPSSTSRRPRPPPPSSLAAAAADHMSSSSAAAAMAADHQIMAPYYDEEPRRPSACSDDAVMFDPYQLPSSARGGYSWLPPQQLALQISQHACTYASDVAMTMAAAATDVDGDEAMRIVSPAAHQIMKSRSKNEVKKVVCIPALPPTSSRPGGGEVIPSDLWAWRKYGQKPIKGSPYPRGYYRCSSSKGCMARKQVERSRSDPNMLVITYTAEHNHPWPMQRNVLAGYSRPHTHNTSTTTTSCKKIKKNSCCRAITTCSSPSSDNNNVVVDNSGNNLMIECQQQTADMIMEEGNASAGYVAYTTIGVATMHQPMSCNDSIQQTADEVFAELEELEPASSNPASENVYSRGVSSYEWHKF